MKYYCKNCKSEFTPGNEKLSLPPVNKPWVHCPFCEKADCEFEIIPDYETPEQYEKRTGKPWPDNAPVWFMRDDEKEFFGGGFWGVCRYKTAKEVWDKIIVCVQCPNPPPDNWRPQ